MYEPKILSWFKKNAYKPKLKKAMGKWKGAKQVQKKKKKWFNTQGSTYDVG